MGDGLCRGCRRAAPARPDALGAMPAFCSPGCEASYTEGCRAGLAVTMRQLLATEERFRKEHTSTEARHREDGDYCRGRIAGLRILHGELQALDVCARAKAAAGG